MKILDEEGIIYEYKKQMRIIELINGSQFIFMGLDDPEKLKSITDICSVWIEEASEISIDEYRQVDLRLRGEIPSYKQIVCTLNPVPSGRWILEIMAEKDESDVYYKVYTYQDNPFLDEEYEKALKSITDDVYKKIYLHGEWGERNTHMIYTNYIPFFLENIEYDCYGLDFGYNNPTALVGIKKYKDGFYVDEIIYKTHLLTNDLIELMKNKKVKGKI